jgi:cytochrome c oxidase subunit 2
MGKWLAAALAVMTIGTVTLFVRHPWWMPLDISADGPLIDRQMIETLAACGLLFVLSQFLLGAFIWKFSGEKEHRVQGLPGGTALLIVIAVLVVLVEILSLGFVGSRVWASIYMTPPRPQAVKIDVQAEQFAYHFRYAGADGIFGKSNIRDIDDSTGNFFGIDPEKDAAAKDDVVSATLVIPVGRQVALTLRSRDVGHGFYIPQLRIQQDFVPGLSIPVHFTALKTGKYEIVCTQLCGLGHATMRSYLQVVTQSEFEEWLKTRTLTAGD